MSLIQNLILACVIVLLLWSVTWAEVLYETYPGTNEPDISKPVLVIEDDRIYQTFPYTEVPDYSKPRYAPKKEPASTWGTDSGPKDQ